MKNNNNKEKLFEVMEKLNPDFKLNEVLTQNNQQISPDVANVQKNITSTQQKANSRIDTPQEFEEGFKVWLSTTGFNPQNKPLSISQAQTLVKNVMISLGFK